MAETSDPQEEAGWHRRTAADLFNRAWELLEAARTPEQDRELLATALASWLHWREVGTPVNLAVADWQVARVYAVLGDAASAEYYARASLERAEADRLGPFYVGYGYEALARAAAVRGDAGGRLAWLARARAEAAEIIDEEARALLAADLDGLEAPRC